MQSSELPSSLVATAAQNVASASSPTSLLQILPAIAPTSLSTLPTLLKIATVVASGTLQESLSSSIGATALVASFPTMIATSGIPQDGEEDTGECKLLGSFAVLVQGALGLLALLSLVYKRWRERPQRPVRVWAFDASKQVFGSVLLHLANLFMSMFSAGQIQATLAKAAASTMGVDAQDRYQPNPCSFYLLNLAIDTTLGIPILILILRLIHAGARLTPIARPLESIQSGNYGQPPKASWWLKQSLLYFVGLLGMKACVFFIFELCPWIIVVGNWALRWTEGNEAIQIAFVMLIFPLIMNAMQYYIIDSFIKNKAPVEGEGEDVDEEDGEGDSLLGTEDAGNTEEIEADETRKEPSVTTLGTEPRAVKRRGNGGELSPGSGTLVGESSNSSVSKMDVDLPPLPTE